MLLLLCYEKDLIVLPRSSVGGNLQNKIGVKSVVYLAACNHKKLMLAMIMPIKV